MKKETLKDTSILIPVKIDTVSRLENLVCVVKFLRSYFEVKIEVLEAGPYKNLFIQNLLGESVNYTFVKDADPIFHRTKYINQMVLKSTSEYLAVWDSDVLCSPIQILKSLEILKKKEADYVYPYTGKFLDTSKIIREMYFSSFDFQILVKFADWMKEMYSPKPVGGAFFIRKDIYEYAGLENEEFYGWGVEDGERASRFSILGLKRGRVLGPLFHLTHDRGINSGFHSAIQNSIKRNQLFKVATMSKNELLDYVRR